MRRIKHVATMRAGGTPPVDNESMWSSDGMPWVSIGDMTRSRRIVTTERRVSEVGINARRLPVGKPGTILFAMYASVGALGVLDTTATWNQALLGIEPRDGLAESRFISYWLEHMRADLARSFRSNTQNNLNADQVANLPFPVTSISQQRAIADLLDVETARIDALIDKKRALVELLEERKAGLVEQRIRELVNRYEERRLKLAASEITVGIVVTPSEWYADVGIPALRGLNVKPGRIERSEMIFLSEEGHRAHPKSVLHAGDVVVVRTGQAGAAAVVPDDLDGANCIDLLIVRPREIDSNYLAHVLNSDWTQKHIAKHSVGTIQAHFNVSALAELPLPVPDMLTQGSVVTEINEVGSSLDATKAKLEAQISLLREHRQALIMAAVTGELEVPGMSR